MTIKEFEEKYYLHDSGIDKIEYDAENKTLKLTIDFCFWMQLWYNAEELPNGYIAVTFENVSVFEYEQHEFSNLLENLDTEVGHTEIENELLQIFIFEYPPSGEDDFWWIKIKAENVKVEEISRYTP